MKNIRFLIASVLLFSISSFASSVSIFRDSMTYIPNLKNQFVGFNDKVKVFCNWSEITTEKKLEVNDDCYLCNLYNDIKQLENKLIDLNNKEKVLTDLLQNLKTDENTFFKMSNQISNEISKIQKEKTKAQTLIDLKKKQFSSLSASSFPIYLSQKCKNPVIKLDKGQINVNLENSLKILSVNNNKAEVEASKILKLSNRSGIDIKADEASVIFQYSTREINTYNFHPKVVYPETLEYFIYYGEEKIVKAAFISDREIAMSKGNRNYKIKNLDLHANGLEHKFYVKDAKINADFSLVVYPYRNKNVYRQLKFKLPFSIDTKYWNVQYNNERFSRVYSYFDEDINSYVLFAGIDYDVLVNRKDLIKKRKPTGFLKNKMKIKLGYKISLTNFGKERKEINVIDRIPISGDKRIEIRDISISNKNCKLEEKGKVSCNINLNPQKTTEIIVKYALIFDKKLFDKSYMRKLKKK